jgi:hypothetical protein
MKASGQVASISYFPDSTICSLLDSRFQISYCWVTSNLAHGFLEQFATRRNFVPRGSSGGMGQRNQIENSVITFNDKFSTDDVFKFFKRNELADGESADRDDQARTKNLEFIVHPGRAIPNFLRAWDPVGPTKGLARETAANGREINSRAHYRFIHSAKLFEPSKQGLTGGMREWAFQYWFTHPRRLTDQHHFANNGTAGDWRRQHTRATAALNQSCNMIL